MLIPLWLPWTVAAAVVLRALLSRDHRGRRDVGLKAVAGLALLVAVVLTVNRVSVDEGELLDAVEHAAALSGGTAGIVPTARLEVLVEDRLGREVELAVLDEASDDPDRVTTRHEVRLADSGDGPVVCLEMTRSSAATVPVTTLSVLGGSCEGSEVP